MYTLDEYQSCGLPKLTDEEFLSLQIWHLSNVFRQEKFAVKNSLLKYVAMSDSFVDEFHLNSQLTISNEAIVFDKSEILSPEIIQQEQLILENREFQSYCLLLHHQKFSYHVRKRSIVNPATDTVVGMSIVVSKYKMGFLYRQYIKQLFGLQRRQKINLQKLSLDEQQQQIVFCLALGYHSRKEISSILSRNTSTVINERKIKTELHKLYEKFECSTTDKIIQEIVTYKIDFDKLHELLNQGNYLI